MNFWFERDSDYVTRDETRHHHWLALRDVNLDEGVCWLDVLKVAVQLGLDLDFAFGQIRNALLKLRLVLHHVGHIASHLLRHLILEERDAIQNCGVYANLNLVKIRLSILGFAGFIIRVRGHITIHRLVVLPSLHLHHRSISLSRQKLALSKECYCVAAIEWDLLRRLSFPFARLFRFFRLYFHLLPYRIE